MRFFWIILGFFAAAGLAYVVLPHASTPEPLAPTPSPIKAEPVAAPAPTLPAPVSPAPSAVTQPTPTTTPAAAATHAPGAPPPAPTTPVEPKPAETKPADNKPAEPAPAAPLVPSASAATYEIIPAETKVRQDDGSLLIDGKWTIKGDGSPANPYIITWEMLTTAEHTFDPRAGSRKIPEAVAMLDGKWVKITGYVAFPMLVQQPRKLLAMLNQWDGCCIGVPPTPYDAIEVRLKEVVTGDARFATFGHITGRFGVNPYVSGDWLIGLYVMDEGSLEIEAFGGFGGE